MLTIPDSFKSLKALSNTQNSVFSLYSNNTLERVVTFFQDATTFFTINNFLKDPDYFKACFENILLNCNTRKLSHDIDIIKVYSGLTNLVYNVLTASEFDLSVVNIMLRNTTNIRLSRIVSVFNKPEQVSLLIQQHRQFSSFSIADYQPALNTSKLTPEIQVQLAHELIVQNLDSFNTRSRLFPYIEDLLIIFKRHNAYIKQDMPDYINSLLTLYSNVLDYGSQLSKTKQRNFIKYLTNIGTEHYGDRFKPAIDTAMSLSLTSHIDYWRSLDIASPESSTYSEITFV